MDAGQPVQAGFEETAHVGGERAGNGFVRIDGRAVLRGDRVGLDDEDIARLAGHSNTRTTEVVYRRELRPVLTTGAEAMDRLFGRGQPEPEMIYKESVVVGERDRSCRCSEPGRRPGPQEHKVRRSQPCE
jgi:hypothetical protein